MRLRGHFLILLITLFPAGPFATTFPVTKTDDTNDGTCDADCSLREAIDAANANSGVDDVPVLAGTYFLTFGCLIVLDDVSIVGAGEAKTIIDGSNASDCVFSMQGFPVSTVEISEVTIQDGYYYFGGGILNTGDLNITNSTVSGNTAIIAGGGVYNTGNLTLTNSTVSGNTAFLGGGVQNYNGTVILVNSTVSGNTAYAQGSGISNYFGTVSLTNSTVSGNTAGVGVGVHTVRGELTLTNSTVSANANGIIADAVLERVTAVRLQNSTISGNDMGIEVRFLDCNGIQCYGYADLLSENSIVAENAGANCSSNWYANFSPVGYNLTDDTTCGFTQSTDLVVADAMLGPLQDNGGPTETRDLLPGSPAIDAGSAACPPPATDQRGVARPQGSACDIGAVEYLPEVNRSFGLIAGVGLLAIFYRRRH